MTMTEKATRYLRLIGKTDDASVILTRGYAKAADELKQLGLAIFIPISSGGCHIALTAKGVEEYERMEDLNP